MKEVLPVTCQKYEDLVESTEGFPPILGYNQTIPRPGFEVILEVKETGDPLHARGTSGKGNVMAYMSDPAPNWGCNFVYWEYYNEFRIACMNSLLDLRD